MFKSTTIILNAFESKKKNHPKNKVGTKIGQLFVLLRIMNIKAVPPLHKIDHYTTIFIIINP
jgi:hypothetical protein